MKDFLPVFWWLGAIPVIALVISSLGYPFGGAIAIAVMFLPGMLCARFFFPQLSFENRTRGIYHCTCLALAVLVMEYLSIFLANYYISETGFDELPPMLMNPFFLLLVLTAFIVPELMLEAHITARHPRNTSISFTSDRRKVVLDPADILYIESNDSEVWIHTTSGEAYRTKTRISQWEAQLDSRFLRIHRSYIVNMNLVTECSTKHVSTGEQTIEISRKYKEEVRRRLAPQS